MRQLIVECDKVIGFFNGLEIAITKEELDNLNYIRKEMTEICLELDEHFEKNLDKAIKAAEKGQFLGSALIISRVIEHVLDKIDGKEIDNKIEFLISKGLLDKNRKDEKENIIMASKKARNLLSHNITIYAESSDTLSLLGNSVLLMKIYKKLLRINNP